VSLATRCAACSTVFRVVQDQLRVSSGWVRCGRCGEVFNAIESLVDLELDRPGDGSSPSVHGARVMDDLARVAGGRPPAMASAEPADATLSPMDRTVRGQSSAQAEAVPAVEAPAIPGDPGLPAGDGPPGDATRAGGAADRAVMPAAGAPLEAANPTPSDDASVSIHEAWPAPTFVREANRAARWRSPGVRLALGALVVLSFSTLLWQVHQSHHDWVAARWPGLAPMVERACAVTGCVLEPPRRIEALVVESSGLVRDQASDAYRLSLVLRNRDRWVLRLPAVDLVMTDARGDVLARRVLDGRTMGAPSDRIEAGTDLSLTARLRVPGPPVVGYTIELFYP
jgi:predicted Zn finger-like uncharacterized protein